MTGPIPDRYQGVDRTVARKRVLEEIEGLGLYRGSEERMIARPYGDRSGVVIEPMLTDQWYVDAKTLAKPAIAAVEEGRTVFEPAHWAKTYFEWMRNIEPWCVSRQLWWGHRIPAWYGPQIDADGHEVVGPFKPFVAETAEQALVEARSYYPAQVEVVAELGGFPIVGTETGERSGKLKYVAITQDPDVLDTWFSSGLWPFSTLGWPNGTEDLRRFYPTDTLVTGFDIIFFWVARMMMMGEHVMGSVPFRRVVINGLVRDEKGQKMSKSKGNVIDPLEIIDALGADALRFTMAISAGARDIKLSQSRIEGYRNFGTKLWNAARFCQMNECAVTPGFDPATLTSPLNRWLRGEVVRAGALVSDAIEAGRFDEAAEALYRFIWNGFCDWYLELAKPVLNGSDERAKAETRAAAAWALECALRLLHPISPFITEELWAQTAEFDPNRSGLLIEAQWPELPAEWVDPQADAQIGLVIATIGEGPVPAGGTSRAALGQASTAHRGSLRRGEAGAAGGRAGHPADAARVGGALRVSAPLGRPAVRGGGGHLRHAAGRRDRPEGRAHPPRQGDRSVDRRRRPHGQEARQRRLRRPRSGGRGAGEPRTPGGSPGLGRQALRGPRAAGSGGGLTPGGPYVCHVPPLVLTVV